MKNKIFSTVLALMLLTAAAAVPLSSCSKSSGAAQPTESEQPTESVQPSSQAEIRTDDATIKTDGSKVEYESDDGKTNFQVDTEGSVDLPEGYPGDVVPIYPNGKVVLAGVEGDGFGISIVTDDSIADIYAYYKANIKLDTLAGEQKTEDMAMFMGISGDMNVSILITGNNLSEEGKNLITIAMGK